MGYLIRPVERNDIPELQKLLDGYYHGEWRGSVERLSEDLPEKIFEISVLETAEGRLEGFLAWTLTYDMNWCMKGGEIIDFYVSPFHRGHGAALMLAAGLAFEIQKQRGTFLKGGAANDTVRRFYSRIARCLPSGECYVSGRAFRHVAGFARRSVREMVRDLPEESWHLEP